MYIWPLEQRPRKNDENIVDILHRKFAINRYDGMPDNSYIVRVISTDDCQSMGV